MSRELSRQCVILVGGLGTRLGAAVRDCPKPMLDVAGRPFLEHLITNISRFGFDDFVLLAGYKGSIVAEQFSGPESLAARLGIRIRTVIEANPRGTAGALLDAKELLEDEFLMMNGDSLFEINLLDLASRHASASWLGRMAMRRIPDASRYGVVEVSGPGTVKGFLERPERKGPGLINGGIYWLRKEVLDWIDQQPCSLEKDVFPRLADAERLAGWEYEGFFIDIGIPQDLESARLGLGGALERPALFFDRDGVLNHDQGYTHRSEDFRWKEGAVEAVKMANDAGWYVFVVTNQAGVARGYYDEETVQRLHAWMRDELRGEGAHIDDFRYCPHHPEGLVATYARVCDCRKPAPGMIADLLRSWPVTREASVLIGDKESDLEAAARAGISARRYRGGNLAELVAGILEGARPHPRR